MSSPRNNPVPAHDVIRLVPDSVHLLITGARSMRGVKEITLTLVFARAGTMFSDRPGHQPGDRRQQLLPELLT